MPLCDVRGLSGLVSFPLGDLAARCTRGNGYLDTEDLDGDNRLDVNVGRSDENFVRYVLPVGDSRYFVRNGVTFYDDVGRPQTWRLYRIPFRQDTVVVGNPNLRQVQAMRVTIPSFCTSSRVASSIFRSSGLSSWAHTALKSLFFGIKTPHSLIIQPPGRIL